MPEYVVERLVVAMNQRSKAVRGSRILVLGLAYKPDIGDVRESPSFELIEKIEALGARVDYNDPHVPRTHRMRNYDLQMSSVPLTAESLRSYDCVVISTHHSAYDWRLIA
jgi:UDP-N-acetyl-D-glucosamine dehydrogenase